MYSCYVIDDELFSVDAMKRYIARIPHLTCIGSNTDSKRAVREITLGPKPDIILLDVQMPGLSGLDVVKLLPKGTTVIFITGHAHFAYEAYENDIVDYLLKPISFERFSRSIAKVIGTFKDPLSAPEKKSLIIPGKRGALVQLQPDEILYIEATDHIMNITTIGGIYRFKITITELLEKLQGINYLRVHRSFIVNTLFIKAIENSVVVMQNDTKIPVSRRFKRSLLEKIKGRE